MIVYRDKEHQNTYTFDSTPGRSYALKNELRDWTKYKRIDWK